MKIELQPTTIAPIYVQVRDQIQEGIKNKTIASGEQLPSPAQLAKKLSVDVGEVQRAYFELEKSNFITKKKGRNILGKETVKYLVK